MNQLIVMRHGKSDWGAGQPDHERPINERGERSAVGMGAVLARAGLTPDHVLSSTAVRARTTSEHVVAGAGWSLDVHTDDRLYESDVATTLRVLSEVPDVDRVLVVGHQPTWGSLLHHLTGASVAVRTATACVIDLPIGTWDEVRVTGGELVAVLQPRHLLTE